MVLCHCRQSPVPIFEGVGESPGHAEDTPPTCLSTPRVGCTSATELNSSYVRVLAFRVAIETENRRFADDSTASSSSYVNGCIVCACCSNLHQQQKLLSVHMDVDVPVGGGGDAAARDDALPGAHIMNDRRGQAKWSGGGPSYGGGAGGGSSLPTMSILGVVIVVVIIVNYYYKAKRSRRQKKIVKPRSGYFSPVKSENT